MTHDHSQHPILWCETHQHIHVAMMPRFTYLCKSCGFGQWYKPDAEAHEAVCPGHETYEVEHDMRPIATLSHFLLKERVIERLEPMGWHRSDLEQAADLILPLISRGVQLDETTHAVACKWCDRLATGTAWWSGDDRRHPSCGTVSHGFNFHPDNRGES